MLEELEELGELMVMVVVLLGQVVELGFIQMANSAGTV